MLCGYSLKTHKHLLKHFLHKYSNASSVVAFMKTVASFFRMWSIIKSPDPKSSMQ